MDNKNTEWLSNIFPQYMAHKLRGDNIKEYKKAEELITGKVTAPDCGCAYHSYQSKVNQLYNTWVKRNT
jgi:hypothetical protein